MRERVVYTPLRGETKAGPSEPGFLLAGPMDATTFERNDVWLKQDWMSEDSESNVKDLMLRKDVVEAVKEGNFIVYSVSNIDEGIEILTGKKAGTTQADGTYPEATINFLVDRKLKELAESIKKFGGGTGEEERKKTDKNSVHPWELLSLISINFQN